MTTVDERNKPIRDIVGQQAAGTVDLGKGEFKPTEQQVKQDEIFVDPKKYQGYAFGIGIDRLAMLKYGINDLRSFFESDYRWLNHYGFDPIDVPTNYRGLSR